MRQRGLALEPKKRETATADILFARRLTDHRVPAFERSADPELRKQRIRTVILEARMDCTIFGKDAAGKPETYQAAFERHFGEPLVLKTARKRA